ncbi:MAG: hypothetical protein KDC92_16710 [Bacteroidetes bacterium]|nr:hypothetical protein [Bacteroidota bacterium]
MTDPKTKATSKPVIVAKDESPKLDEKLLTEIKSQINTLEQKNTLLSEKIKTLETQQPTTTISKTNLTPLYASGILALVIVLVFFWVLLQKIKLLKTALLQLEAKYNIKNKSELRDKKSMPDLDVIKRIEIVEKDIKGIKEIDQNKIKKYDEALREIILHLNASGLSQKNNSSTKNVVPVVNQKSVEETKKNETQLKIYNTVLLAINEMLKKRPTLNPASLPKHLTDNINHEEIKHYIKSINFDFSLHYLDGSSAPSNAELICFKLNNAAFVFPHYNSFNNPNLASWFDVFKDTQPFGILKLAWVERNEEGLITIIEKGVVNT